MEKTIRRNWRQIVLCTALASLLSTGIGLFGSAHAQQKEDLAWTNGDVQLRGTLRLPKGPGPFPAFIILHGAGSEDRGAFNAKRYNDQFVKQGFAVLHYDKRGAGKSTGDWLTSDYKDLAEDAVAGIELLVARKDIAASRIGVIGFSEGGWTGPLTASLSNHVSLLIVVSAPPMSPFEQDNFDYASSLRKDGASDTDVAEALKLRQLRFDALRTDTGWAELDQAIEVARSRSWYKLAGSPVAPDKNSTKIQWYKRVMDYDPVPVWKQIDIPVLALYGDQDPIVDAKRSAAAMHALKESERKDFTIYVYPDGGHNLTSNGFRFQGDHWDRIFAWIDTKWGKPQPKVESKP